MHASCSNVCANDNAASSYNSFEPFRQKWYRHTRLIVTVTDASEIFTFKYNVSTIRFLLLDLAIYHLMYAWNEKWTCYSTVLYKPVTNTDEDFI